MARWQILALIGAAALLGVLAACDQAGNAPSAPTDTASDQAPAADAATVETPAAAPGTDCKDPPIASPVRENFGTSVRSYARSGGNLNQVTCDGDSLVYLATGPRGGISVLRALLENGADFEIGSAEGRTPLMNAAGWCDVNAVRILLEAGADATKVGPGGKTALDSICAEPADRRQQVVDLLEAAIASGT